METLIVAGGDINIKNLEKCCKEHIRAKYYRS